jgi:dodecin
MQKFAWIISQASLLLQLMLLSKVSKGGVMSDHIYKQIELTGSSKTSVEDAVQNAITKASKTLHNLNWFQVVETRGYIENNRVDYWQVTIKLGFRLDD